MEKYAFGWCLLHGFDFSCCLLLPDIHQSCNITYVVDIFMEKNLRSAGLKPSMATTLHSRASCECHTRFYWQLQWLRFIYTVITTVKILSQGMRNAKGQESTQNTHTAEALGVFFAYTGNAGFSVNFRETCVMRARFGVELFMLNHFNVTNHWWRDRDEDNR